MIRDTMRHHVPNAYQEKPGQEPHLHQTFQRHLRRLAYLLFLLFLLSLTSCDNGVAAQRKEGRTFPLLSAIPETSFSCKGQTAGYYADMETGCQGYHMCDTLQKQYSYLCPNYTLFNQKFMVCDHWYMVNCSTAADYYSLNDHIGEVPNSKEGEDDNNVNAIGLSVNTRPTERSRDTTVKEPKTAPVTFTFKAPGSFSLKPQIPTNSLVTAKSTPDATTADLPEVTTPFSVSSLSSLRPSLTTKPFQSHFSSITRQQFSQTTSKPTTTPSRFFQLPKVESDFNSRSNFRLKTAPPPSVFFQPPNRSESSKSDISGPKSEIIANNSSNHVHSAAHHDIPFVQTPRPGVPFTMIPGIVARDPGNKFTFTSSRQKKPSLFGSGFNGIVFRPLVHLPKDKTRKIFTTAPASVTSNPHHLDIGTTSDQDTQHSTTTVFAAPLTNSKAPTSGTVTPASTPVGIRVPSSLILPPPFLPLTLNIPPFLPQLQQTLIPPKRMKQEFLTQLVMPVRFTSTKAHQPFQESNGIIQFQFPVSRSNRDFFIPAVGLSLPEEEEKESPGPHKNNLFDHQNSLIHSVQHKKTNMTMVFPAPSHVKLTALQLNPKCPKCHPAFLRLGECTPCVLIR